MRRGRKCSNGRGSSATAADVRFEEFVRHVAERGEPTEHHATGLAHVVSRRVDGGDEGSTRLDVGETLHDLPIGGFGQSVGDASDEANARPVVGAHRVAVSGASLKAVDARAVGRRVGVLLILVLFCLPLGFGLVGTLLPALGTLPGVAPIENGHGASTDSGWFAQTGFAAILSDPRTLPAIAMSLFTGVLATTIAFALTIVTLIAVHDTRGWRWLQAALPPLLAVPHAALAVGLAFLIAPSGWLVRLMSPTLTGWERPPLDWVVPDPHGLSLLVGLVLKETPFLLLVAGAQLATLNVDASMRIGRTLGYAPARCWSRLILPQLYPRIRLTVLVILAFNLSVVDMALLLGPGNPPTFAVMLLSLVNDPGSRAAASAGAIVLAVVVGLCFVGLSGVERGLAAVARYRRTDGRRGRALGHARRAALGFVLMAVVLSILSLLMLPLWSFARRWRFPDSLPSEWTLRHWSSRGDLLLDPLWTTLLLALVSAGLALLAATLWLEHGRAGQRDGPSTRGDWLWYVPLLVPQVSLLFGWQAMGLLAAFDGAWLTVVHAHWVYAMPYVVLILAVAWRESDPNWEHAAATLGAGYWRTLWRVRLPLLSRPVAQALAVAIAVSVAQYLPTLLLGAGRYQTLTTELVTSFGGVDRRAMAALAVLQSLLPLVAFVLALVLPSRIGQGANR